MTTDTLAPQDTLSHLYLHQLTQPKQLNSKAMLVRLNISKPTTSRRDEQAEAFTQSQLADRGLRVSSTLFKEKTNPVRCLLNSQNAVYHFHKLNTTDAQRSPDRLLPVNNFAFYRDSMRVLVAEVEQELKQVMPNYDTYVQDDMRSRGSRASLADYPTAYEFEQSFKMVFTFQPLPDESHFLFDIDPEYKAALTEQLKDIEKAAYDDLYARLREPVTKLIAKLAIPAGTPGAIFRDTAVTNITEAVSLARQLAMGDETILKMCDDVALTIAPVKDNPDVLRESPVVREAAVVKLQAVSDRMAFMFGGAA